MEQRISIERMEQAVNIFGSFDENIRLLEKEFSVTVTNRDGELRISGEAEDVMHAAKAVQAMLTLSSRGEALGEQNVRYIIDMVRTGKEEQISELAGDVLCISAKGRPVKPKTIGQKEYIQSVLKNTVTIGVGPAGTGKTYLAVAAAVQADLLILLSDIDGLYDGDPHRDPAAKLIPVVPSIDAHILALGGGSGSGLGTGGMATKLKAAQIVTEVGCQMVIANGSKPALLYDIVGGKPVGTRFLAKEK